MWIIRDSFKYTFNHHFRTVWNLGILCKNSPLHSWDPYTTASSLSRDRTQFRTGTSENYWGGAQGLLPVPPKSQTGVPPLRHTSYLSLQTMSQNAGQHKHVEENLKLSKQRALCPFLSWWGPVLYTSHLGYIPNAPTQQLLCAILKYCHRRSASPPPAQEQYRTCDGQRGSSRCTTEWRRSSEIVKH